MAIVTSYTRLSSWNADDDVLFVQQPDAPKKATPGQIRDFIESSYDSSPTSGSNHAVKSGGVYSALADKTDKQTNTDGFWGTCSTAAATDTKVVTLTDPDGNFSLRPGVRIFVKFTHTNTSSTPDLNVNGTGAKSIWYNGGTAMYIVISDVSGERTYNNGIVEGAGGAAGRVTEYVYDGTNWCWVGDGKNSDNILADETTGEVFKLGVSNGLLFIEDV